jgi:hypothetical protein
VNNVFLKTPVIGIIAIVVWGAAMVAADPVSQADATTQPADKSQYNLFHPVPSNQLRGMDTDRPNITNTPHTIDAGHLQLEAGFVDYSFYHHVNFRSDDLAVGELNFRLGVLNQLELNAVVNAFEIDRNHDYGTGKSAHANGFGDTVLGGKLNFWGNESGDRAWTTAFAIQPQFKFPTAGRDEGNGKFEFAAGFPFLLNLPAGFHLGLQTGVSDERSTANRGYVTGWQNAICLDRNLIGKLDVYVEYASDLTTEKHAQPVQTFDVGYVYPLTDNLVLDTGLNFGLNKVSDNVEVLVGMSVRF